MPREWKEKEVEELKGLLEDNPVIGIINMHKLPAPQLQDMRKDLHGKAEIRMSRKTLMKLALEKAERENIKELEDYLKGEAALIFTEMNPFRLYSYLQENKSSALAKAGDIAPNDIIVNEGSTGIDPGPAIGKLQNAGIQTSIEDGKIYVQKESVVAEDGEEITPKVAGALKMLDMEPMEIGLNLKAVWEDGVLFEPGELKIDKDEYVDKIKTTYARSLNLSVNSGYLTSETAPLLLMKAWSEARSLAIAIKYPANEIIEDLIRKCHAEGKALKSKEEEVS
jgi:large subunit ribosomal protein L10